MAFDRQTDFASAVLDLKADIRKAVQAAVDSFESRTGATPCGIDIPLIERMSHGDKIGRFCVGDVKVSLGEF
jgi:hypothetical protein